jgi:hypothetical protein
VRKRRLKLVAKIPNYVPDGVAWKRAIYRAVTKAQRDAGVQYTDTDKLALSTITIRRYNRDARTVADPRETRKL